MYNEQTVAENDRKRRKAEEDKMDLIKLIDKRIEEKVPLHSDNSWFFVFVFVLSIIIVKLLS